MIVFASLPDFTSLAPSKLMPYKSNHDFKEKYPYVRVRTCLDQNIKFGKEVKTIIVGDISRQESIRSIEDRRINRSTY